MKRGLVVMLSLAMIFGISSAWAQKKNRLSIVTGGTGGVYYPYGGAIASVISKYVPGVEATAEVTATAVDNSEVVAEKAKELTLQNAVINTVVSYHPGAIKFFKEKGVTM